MDYLLKRTSIRQFTSQLVEGEKQMLLMQAAMAAPSAKNHQPWEFILVENKETLSELASYSPNGGPIGRAPLGIISCIDLNRMLTFDYAQQDLAAATENILIAATALGMGGVWIGMYPYRSRVEQLRRYFNLPKHIMPLWMVAIGYPAKQKQPMDKFNPNYIHIEKW